MPELAFVEVDVALRGADVLVPGMNGGWYVQCKLGTKPLNLKGDDNAVFVEGLADVAGVLDAFEEAVKAGELDQSIGALARTGDTKAKERDKGRQARAG